MLSLIKGNLSRLHVLEYCNYLTYFVLDLRLVCIDTLCILSILHTLHLNLSIFFLLIYNLISRSILSVNCLIINELMYLKYLYHRCRSITDKCTYSFTFSDYIFKAYNLLIFVHFIITKSLDLHITLNLFLLLM